MHRVRPRVRPVLYRYLSVVLIPVVRAVFGPVFGLVFSPVFGLVFSSVFDPVFSPVFGLVFSSVFGLVFSPVFGLVSCPGAARCGLRGPGDHCSRVRPCPLLSSAVSDLFPDRYRSVSCSRRCLSGRVSLRSGRLLLLRLSTAERTVSC